MSHSTASLIVRDMGATRILTLSRPERRNAFNAAMRNRIVEELRKAAKQPELRAVIMTGADGYFCAGADLSEDEADDGMPGPLALRETMREILEIYRAIVAGPLPVIAAVEGGAFGAGLSIAAACDMVVAGRSAKFGAAFSRVGLFPDCGLLHTLPQRIGIARARRIITLGATLSAEDGVNMGLVDELVEDGATLARAEALAAEYAAVAPLTVAYTRMALAAGIASVDDLVRTELDLVPLLAGSVDFREGVRAFAEKRKPRFKGC